MTAGGDGGLRSLISDDRLSKTARIRRWWTEIDRLKSEGVSDQMLVEALAKAGVSFTSRSAFATTLARVRKEVASGEFQPIACVATSDPSPKPQFQASTGPTSAAPTPLRPISPKPSNANIYAPRPTKKELREQKAARIPIDRPENNPLFAAILKKSSK